MSKSSMFSILLVLAGLLAYNAPCQTLSKKIVSAESEVSLGLADPGINWESLVASSDGEHVAYISQRWPKWLVMVDGVEGEKYDQIGEGSLTFSPDGQHFAHSARRGDKWLVVADGIEGKEYAGIWDIIFSPDSRHLAYTAGPSPILVFLGLEFGYKSCVIVDREEFNWASNPVFSVDGKRLAHAARRNDKEFIVVDGKEGKEYDEIHDIIFSPKGRQVAYAAECAGKSRVVLGGREGIKYDDIHDLIFSADGEHLAYAAGYYEGKYSTRTQRIYKVVTDPQGGVFARIAQFLNIGKRYDAIAKGSLTFSSDGKRLAYAVRLGNRWRIVVDRQEGKEYDDIGSLIFSPDGQHLAYGARSGEKWLVVVDGQEGKEYGRIGIPIFSPDGKRLAYTAQRGAKWLIVVDGAEGEECDGFVRGSKLVFDSPNTLHALTFRDNEFFRVEITIQE